MTNKTVYIISLFMILLITGCEQEKDFAYDIELLTGTEWGLPRIQETGPAGGGFVQSSPNVFYEDGRVSFGGRTDFWRVRDSRSLLIEQRQEIWQVLNLTENELHVEVLKYPNGEFMVNAIYYPLEE
jgi:hypothetical protein